MARETLGYARLIWVCPNCGGKNPGTEKKCSTCGGLQPENVSFQADERDELVTDPAEAEKAKSGADFHCPYCGARNPADATTCVQCLGDLKDAKKREAGQIVGALKTGPQAQVSCPSCGAPNPDTGQRCQKCGAPLATSAPVPQKTSAKQPIWLYIVGVFLLILLACGCFWLFSQLTKSTETTGTVQNVSWSRSIVIEKYGLVSKSNWKDEIPQDGQMGSCEWREHHTQSEPADNAEKVCGTPYKIDKGNGYAEVVQDCEYIVKKEYCEYKVNDWQKFDEARTQGSDLNPIWPDPNLADKNLRWGTQSEFYKVTFLADGKSYTYNPKAEDYNQFEIGSQWKIGINGFGDVVSVKP